LSSGIVFDVKRYAIHDGPGIRTTVFLKGCPLKCWWCHNPEGLSAEQELVYHQNRCILCGACIKVCPQHAVVAQDDAIVTEASACDLCRECVEVCAAESREIVGRTMSTEEVMTEVLKDMPFYQESGGGATFSGGEPLMQPEFLFSLLEACRRLDLHTAVDTTGHAGTQLLLKAAEKADLLLYDLKHMNPAIHQKYTGVSNEVILDNLKSLDAGEAKICIRFPLIPGINDDKSNVRATGAFLQQRSKVECVDILPFHGNLSGKYRRLGRDYRLENRTAPDAAHIHRIAEMLAEFGLKVTIGGNDYERADSKTATGQS